MRQIFRDKLQCENDDFFLFFPVLYKLGTLLITPDTHVPTANYTLLIGGAHTGAVLGLLYAGRGRAAKVGGTV